MLKNKEFLKSLPASGGQLSLLPAGPEQATGVYLERPGTGFAGFILASGPKTEILYFAPPGIAKRQFRPCAFLSLCSSDARGEVDSETPPVPNGTFGRALGRAIGELFRLKAKFRSYN